MAELNKPIHTFHDESLNKSATLQYILSIQLSLNGFSFCLLDADLNKFVALESYRFHNIDNSVDLCKQAENIILSHDLLHKKFKKVILIYENEKTTLIPDPLFDQAEKELYLRFNHPVNEYEDIAFDNLRSIDAKNVFALPDCLKYKLGKIYPGIVFHHNASVFIESTLSKYKNQLPDKRVFINIRDGKFDLMITEAERLMFFNAFEYLSIEDYIYYLMNALEQNSINPLETNFVLFGNFDKASPLYEIMENYIKNMEYGERTAAYSYSHVLAQIQNHHYYTLFNVHICEL